MRTAFRTAFADVPWEEVMPGVRHKVSDQGGRRLRLVEYTPEMKPHWCEKGHFGYLLEGRFEIEFLQEKHIYGPGDGLSLPPGQAYRHRAKALTEVVRVFFVEELTKETMPQM